MSEKQLRLYRDSPPTMTGPVALRLRLVPPNAVPRDRSAAPAPAPMAAPVLAPVAAPLSIDDQIFAILDAPVEGGVTISYAYREKEQALAAYFTTLTVADARALHRRLTIPDPNDALAVRFSRLVVERRARLVAVLADARRREAIASQQRV